MKAPIAARIALFCHLLMPELISSSMFAAEVTVPPSPEVDGPLAPAITRPARSSPAPASGASMRTFSSFDAPDAASDEVVLQTGMLSFSNADLSQVLPIYQDLSGRSVIYGAALPHAKISFTSQTALSRREALQALDTVLAQNGIIMIYLGTKLVKAVPAAQAASEAAPVIELPPEQLPDSGSFLIYFVTLKHRAPQEILPAVAPLSKTPNSLIAFPGNGLLMMRDQSCNIRRMLEVIRRLDVPTAKTTNAIRPPGKG